MTRARKERSDLFAVVKRALEPLLTRAMRKKISPESSLLADLGMDSLKVVELTVLLEKELGRPVFLPDWIASADDPADLTVGSLARYLARDQE